MENKIIRILRAKPLFIVLTTVFYLIVSGLLKWDLHPQVNMLWYFVGGIIGIYLFDIANDFFDLHPSPFFSIFFIAAYSVVTLFVVSSSTSILSKGLVLSLYLQLIIMQILDIKLAGNLNSWYRVFTEPVPNQIQQAGLAIQAVFFLFLTVSFIA